MASKKFYSDKEKEMLVDELDRHNGVLGAEDFEAMANVWPGLFGTERHPEALKIAASRLFTRNSKTFRFEAKSRSKNISRVAAPSVPPKARPLLPPLQKLKYLAKEIKKLTEGFCAAVDEFAEEFEQNKELLRKLAKLRQAAEEIKL